MVGILKLSTKPWRWAILWSTTKLLKAKPSVNAFQGDPVTLTYAADLKISAQWVLSYWPFCGLAYDIFPHSSSLEDFLSAGHQSRFFTASPHSWNLHIWGHLRLTGRQRGENEQTKGKGQWTSVCVSPSHTHSNIWDQFVLLLIYSHVTYIPKPACGWKEKKPANYFLHNEMEQVISDESEPNIIVIGRKEKQWHEVRCYCVSSLFPCSKY